MKKYRGDREVMIADISRLPITHVRKTVFTPYFSPHQIHLENVYHVSSMKKNPLSISQLTTSGSLSCSGPEDVKVYHNLMPEGKPIMQGKKLESI